MRELNLKKMTTSLVIDHVTVHTRTNTASIHVLEKADERPDSGQDIDGVTTKELGITGSMVEGLDDEKMVKFVKAIAGGQTPVTIDEAPPEPEVEK